MPTFPFQKQTNFFHTIQSILIALSFTTSLENRDLRDIVRGLVTNDSLYISNLKIREYLQQKERYLSLTTKARHVVSKIPVEMIRNKTGGDTKIHHEIQLARTLFACLLHLNFQEIWHIKKQKAGEGQYFHDLTIAANNYTLLLEVDTGTQPIKTLEAKIQGFQEANNQETLIYFTSSIDTYNRCKNKHSGVQFAYLQSPTLSEDILQLTVQESKRERTGESEARTIDFPTADYLQTSSDFHTHTGTDLSATDKLIRSPDAIIENKPFLKRLLSAFRPEQDSQPFSLERNFNSTRSDNQSVQQAPDFLPTTKMSQTWSTTIISINGCRLLQNLRPSFI
jgi:hypothetical protein